MKKQFAKIADNRSIKTKLYKLLELAENKFRELGEQPIWSSYDSGITLADFVAQRKKEIEDGVITLENKKELLCIFAPTCDWDDTVGDVGLGNRIFTLLEKLGYRN